MVVVEGSEPSTGRRSRAARVADRRLGGALRLGGAAALLWPFTLVTPARWIVGPLVAAAVTWSLIQARPSIGQHGRPRFDRCLDLVMAIDALLVVQIIFPDRPAWSVPWLPALALGAAVSFAGGARDEATTRGLARIATNLARARVILLVALIPAFLVIAWGPLSLHRRIGSGTAVPIAGTWYVSDRGWVLAAGAVVILIGAAVAALTTAGHRFRIAVSGPDVGKI